MSAALKPSPHIGAILDRLAEDQARPVLWERGADVSARMLQDEVARWARALDDAGVPAGALVGYEGDYGLSTIALFLALAATARIVVPFTPASAGERPGMMDIARVEWLVDPRGGGIAPTGARSDHPLVAELRRQAHPGLVVFTSGSTGKPKAILHDLDSVASKFARPRQGWRMILFLLMDHFGGINTLLSCLAYRGVGICPDDRSPEGVGRAIEGGRAELLPTTPTFLAMLRASGVAERFDLSTVRLVTYGAEPMPDATLKRLPTLFPNAELKQTYGLSELGVLRSASPDPGSLWLRIGGDGFETKVVDSILYVRSRSNMMGYLNAPSPIDADGWMSTGDLVEERDGLIRFRGRRSEMINVGGQKVLPAEVETVLLEDDNVADATVVGIPHALLGQVVSARLSLVRSESEDSARSRIRAHCAARLQKYKVPMRFEFVALDAHSSARAKKSRIQNDEREGSQ